MCQIQNVLSGTDYSPLPHRIAVNEQQIWFDESSVVYKVKCRTSISKIEYRIDEGKWNETSAGRSHSVYDIPAEHNAANGEATICLRGFNLKNERGPEACFKIHFNHIDPGFLSCGPCQALKGNACVDLDAPATGVPECEISKFYADDKGEYEITAAYRPFFVDTFCKRIDDDRSVSADAKVWLMHRFKVAGQPVTDWILNRESVPQGRVLLEADPEAMRLKPDNSMTVEVRAVFMKDFPSFLPLRTNCSAVDSKDFGYINRY